jgi:UDP-glucose 4-epimerase
MAENYCVLYHRLYEVPVAIARFFNVYGPRQIESGPYATVIGVFEKQKREKQPITITGTGEQRRDFTHVSDIVDGLLMLSQQPWKGNIFNLGTGENFSLNEVAAMFESPTVHIPKRPGEAWITKADISPMRELGWRPQYRLPDYIREIQ